MAAETKKKAQQKSKVRLRLRAQAYEHRILDDSMRQILDTCERLGVKTVGPVPLPTEIKKYTVNRSTFIFKDAREQFEMRTHRRFVDILDPSQRVIEALTNLTLPSGVSVDVRTLT